MARVFAEFVEFSGIRCRHDTRLYLGEQCAPYQSAGRCVGVFYLQNPGKSEPILKPVSMRLGRKKWRWSAVRQDRLMNKLVSILDKSLARIDNDIYDDLRTDAYVQLLNVAYVCDHESASSAFKKWEGILRTKMDEDDALTNCEHIRFFAFCWGKWGTRIVKGTRGDRISQLLESLGIEGIPLLFPTKNAVSAIAAGKSERAIKEQIVRYACDYPSRVTYASRFSKTLTKLLNR